MVGRALDVAMASTLLQGRVKRPNHHTSCDDKLICLSCCSLRKSCVWEGVAFGRMLFLEGRFAFKATVESELRVLGIVSDIKKLDLAQ